MFPFSRKKDEQSKTHGERVATDLSFPWEWSSCTFFDAQILTLKGCGKTALALWLW